MCVSQTIHKIGIRSKQNKREQTNEAHQPMTLILSDILILGAIHFGLLSTLLYFLSVCIPIYTQTHAW